jgi:hypothetical protein
VSAPVAQPTAAEIFAEIAVLRERVTNLTEQVHDLAEGQRRLIAQANRWKGAIGVLLALGALAGWLADQFGERLTGGGG